MHYLIYLLACGDPAPQPTESSAASVSQPATTPDAPEYADYFQALPISMASDSNPATDSKITLGRMLYYEKRLSKNHDISCNSCHQLDNFGVDSEPTSPGHKGQRGGRNSPTVYNAALHIAQFWDGREPDVEAQAGGPVLNPIEMAMPSKEAVVALLKSMDGYVEAFENAFPNDRDPVTYTNMQSAIGAFERNLVTPSPFDAYLAGEQNALTDAQQRGLKRFVETGCVTCHMGPAVGGSTYQKLGVVNSYPSEDVGRFAVTGHESDKYVFKVPSLRNIAKTGPYFHDGSVGSLDEAIKLMSYHQLGKALTDGEVHEIRAFLGALTGEIPLAYVVEPPLPLSGPNTPAPDPT